MTRSRKLAEQALALDPQLAEAHVSLGLVQWNLDRDRAAAEHSLKRGLELNPNYVFGLQVYAGRLAVLGRLDEALEHLLRAEELDPLGVNPAREATLGWIYWLRGEDDRAVATWRADIELEPGDPNNYLQLGIAYCEKGQFEAGIEVLKRAAELSAADALITGDLAYCYARAGRTDEAREMAAELERRAEVSYISPMAIAIIYAGLDEREAAFSWLERAYELHALSLPTLVTDFRWYALADDPRYTDLVHRIDVPIPLERIEKRRR